MGDEIEKVQGIDKKKKEENPAIAAFYENMLKDLQKTTPLNPEQSKVHQTAASALHFASDAMPTLSGDVDSGSLPKHSSHPYGYNLFLEVYQTLYAPKEAEFARKQKEITEEAADTYRLLDYLIHLRQRIRKEKSKMESSNGKEPVIESIDFSLSPIQGHISLTKKAKVEKSDIVLSDEFSKVLAHQGYNVQALKEKADSGAGKESGRYVITFDGTVSAKTKAEFSSRLKECAALEHLQENHHTEILAREGKERYNFSKLSKEEAKKFVKALKDLEQTVTTRCEQMPTDANNTLAKLQPLQSAERLIGEAFSGALKDQNKANEQILRNMAR